MKIGEIALEKRARNVSLIGLLLQVIICVSLLLLFLANHSIATYAASRFAFGGIFVWLAAVIVYQQRRHVAQEALDTEDLKKERQAGGAESIFEMEQEEYLVAKRRLDWMVRWLIPGFVLVTVFYLLAGHLFFWPPAVVMGIGEDALWMPVEIASLSMFLVAGIAFVSFLFSRYVSGMAREAEYRLLKAGAIYLFGNAILCLLITVCLGLVNTKMVLPEQILAMGIRYLLVVLGVEFLGNLILNFYRPRTTKEILRPAYESRLIGMISESGGIAKSIAEAVNYQFGFEVSTTWFYKMLERAVVPLVALSVVMLLGMTSLSVVDADELAVIERFGERLSEKPIGPGLHFKMPWPIDQMKKVKVGLVQEIVIGEAKESKKIDEHASDEDKKEEVITWTEQHGHVPSIDVIVATAELERLSAEGQEDELAGGRDVAVSILRVSMLVQYRVRSDSEGFFDYLYNYRDPQGMLRDIAYRELVKQAVHFDYKKIMGEQRREVTNILRTMIQEKSDEMGLGLVIVFVGLQDVHPPTESDVAATFQRVATAQQEMNTLIQSAQIEYTITLTEVSGDVTRAELIYDLVQKKDESSGDAERLTSIEEDIDKYLLGDAAANVLPIRGDAGEELAKARAYASQAVNRAKSKVNTFKLELVAFQASPRLYRMRKVLSALSDEIDDIRKYVVIVDPESVEFIIELVETESAGLQILE